MKDVAKIVATTINKNLKYKLYNICRSKPILTNKLVNLIKEYFPQDITKLEKIPFVKKNYKKGD